MVEPEFKVGDLVGLKYCSVEVKLHVIEVIIQTCPGGVQAKYLCRMILKRPNGGTWNVTTGDPRWYNESEVEIYKGDVPNGN